MTSIRRSLVLTLLLLVAAAGLSASEYNGRSYSLHTLDYRVAETLVWEICDENDGKGPNCRVQAASPGGLNVYASQEVHAQIVAMLAERDQTTPTSLLFEIVLVRLTDDGADRRGSSPAPHQQRALDAIREVFPGKRAEIVDAGLVRTATAGQTQLADRTGDAFTAQLEVRSIVSGAQGLEFSIDLRILHADKTVLVSSVSIAEGETVVAGSSRTGGETAMVVLLTSKQRS